MQHLVNTTTTKMIWIVNYLLLLFLCLCLCAMSCNSRHKSKLSSKLTHKYTMENVIANNQPAPKKKTNKYQYEHWKHTHLCMLGHVLPCGISTIFIGTKYMLVMYTSKLWNANTRRFYTYIILQPKIKHRTISFYFICLGARIWL